MSELYNTTLLGNTIRRVVALCMLPLPAYLLGREIRGTHLNPILIPTLLALLRNCLFSFLNTELNLSAFRATTSDLPFGNLRASICVLPFRTFIFISRMVTGDDDGFAPPVYKLWPLFRTAEMDGLSELCTSFKDFHDCCHWILEWLTAGNLVSLLLEVSWISIVDSGTLDHKFMILD